MGCLFTLEHELLISPQLYKLSALGGDSGNHAGADLGGGTAAYFMSCYYYACDLSYSCIEGIYTFLLMPTS